LPHVFSTSTLPVSMETADGITYTNSQTTYSRALPHNTGTHTHTDTHTHMCTY
jgi:hypothetical protein